MFSERIKGFVTRHASSARHSTPENPLSKDYASLTEKGVEQSKELARQEIFDLIKNAPDGSVIFLGGSSDQKRTADTLEIYGDELEKLIYNELKENSVEVITKNDIERLAKDSAKRAGSETPDYESVLGEIDGLLREEDPKKKFIIDFPLELKGFSYGFRDRWTKGGKKTDYFSALLEKHGDSHLKAGLDWLKNKGRLEQKDGSVLQGPDPTQVAKEYVESIRRLQVFARKHTDRPLFIGGVGHQWDLDALITYLASDRGEVTCEKFLEVAGDAKRVIMDETEFFEFEIMENKILVKYRGKEYEVKQKDSTS